MQSGVDGRLIAPGVVPTGPDTPGAAIANQILRSTDEFRQTVGAVGAVARDIEVGNLRRAAIEEDRRRQQDARLRQQEEQERRLQQDLDRAVTVARGEGAQIAVDELPEFTTRIANGEFEVPTDARNITEAAKTISERLAEERGLEGETRAGFVNRINNVIATALSARMEFATNESRNNILSAASSGFYEAAANDEPIDELVLSTATSSGIPANEIVSRALIPALNTAARTGNNTAFDRIASAVPDGVATQELAVARDVLKTNLEQARRAQQSRAYEDAIGTVNNVMLGKDTLDSAYTKAVDARNDGQIDEGQFTSIVDKLTGIADARRRDNNILLDRQVRQQASQLAAMAFDRGNVLLVRDVPTVSESGKPDLISGQKLIEQTVDDFVNATMARTDIAPQEKHRVVFDKLRSNNVFHRPTIERMTQSMRSMSTIAAVGEGPLREQEFARIRNTMFEFAEMRQAYPEMVKELPENVRLDLEALNFATQRIHGGNPDTAIQAFAINSGRSYTFQTGDTQKIQQAAANAARRFGPFNNFKNVNDVTRAMTPIAAYHLRTVGNIDDAIELAVENFNNNKLEIGRNLVYFTGRLPEGMTAETFGNSVNDYIKDIASTHGKLNVYNGEPLSEDNIIPFFDERLNGQWSFIDARNGATVRIGNGRTDLAAFSHEYFSKTAQSARRQRISGQQIRLQTRVAPPLADERFSDIQPNFTVEN
jgi:hypothetical protein